MTETRTAPYVADASLVRDYLISEAALQESVTGLCDALGLPWMHITDARGQAAEGFPDLFIADTWHGVAYAWELKRQSGRVRAKQAVWLAALAHCTRLESGLIRPSNWSTVEQLLTKGAD